MYCTCFIHVFEIAVFKAKTGSNREMGAHRPHGLQALSQEEELDELDDDADRARVSVFVPHTRFCSEAYRTFRELRGGPAEGTSQVFQNPRVLTGF